MKRFFIFDWADICIVARDIYACNSDHAVIIYNSMKYPQFLKPDTDRFQGVRQK